MVSFHVVHCLTLRLISAVWFGVSLVWIFFLVVVLVVVFLHCDMNMTASSEIGFYLTNIYVGKNPSSHFSSTQYMFPV